MKLPIGTLIYWVKRVEENRAVILGIWYYNELYVPSNIEEKKKSIQDLKEKRCKIINIHGRYDQITDIISMCDRFIVAGEREIAQYLRLLKEIENYPLDKAYLFDDIYNIKGTSLMIDMVIDIDETMEEIQELLRKRQIIDVNISESWSLAGDFMKHLMGK